jgi:hypothetical protein
MQPKIKNKEKTQHATVEILDPCDAQYKLRMPKFGRGPKPKLVHT